MPSFHGLSRAQVQCLSSECRVDHTLNRMTPAQESAGKRTQQLAQHLQKAPELLESLTLSSRTTSPDLDIQRLLSRSRLRALTAECSPSSFQDIIQHLTALSSLTCLTLRNAAVPYRTALELTRLPQLHCLTLSSAQHPAAHVQTCEEPTTAEYPPGVFQLVALDLSGSQWHAADLSVRPRKPFTHFQQAVIPDFVRRHKVGCRHHERAI